MPNKTTTASQTKDTQKTRVTSARHFSRNRQKQFAVVPKSNDGLLEKEKHCCVVATD